MAALRIPVVALLASAVLGCIGPAARTSEAAPPPGSPLAFGHHPRIMFTASELPRLRDRIAAHYKPEFQAFLDLLADPDSQLTSGQKTIANHWGSMNYAFVAVLDPGQMTARGFSIAAQIDTPAELCGRAMQYAQTQLPLIAAGKQQGHSSLTTGYSYNYYLPVVATYDWCYPHLAQADRAAIADAFVAVYDLRYRNKDVSTMSVAGLSMVANNLSSANTHDILGILAFYGDAYPSASLQAEMYQAFDDFWLKRVFTELNTLYPHGTGWHEGPGGYLAEGYLNLALPVAMMGPAVGRDLFGETPFFADYPIFAVLVAKPNTLAETCGESGTEACPTYLDRWGAISGGIAGISCSTMRFASGVLARRGHPNAALAKSVWNTTHASCNDTDVTRYAGTWANAIFWWFAFGDREVVPKNAASFGVPKSRRLGLGVVGMKSGFGPTDSQVMFFAQEPVMYGHDTPDFGSFSLHKYGNLVLQGVNGKSGEGQISPPQGTVTVETIAKNLLTLHKGDNDPGLTFSGSSTPHPVLPRLDLGAKVNAITLTGTAFDYVSYDNSYLWNPSVAERAQREFVFLRGPENREYVLVFDRLTAKNPAADEKIWRIWVPTKPEFVNGTPTTPRPGKWTSSTSNSVVLVNKFSRLVGDNAEFAPTHGKFYLKTLLPQVAVINFLGGEGMEIQSGNDDGATPWGTPTMTQAAREYLGWGRIEVRPSVPQASDVFLNVFQIGNADTMSAQTPILRVESTDGAMVGAHVRDGGNEWVVLFARSGWPEAGRRGVTYSFQPASGSSKHLLVNMRTSATFYLKTIQDDSGSTISIGETSVAGATPVTSSADGVIYLSINGQSVVPVVPPASPAGVRILQ